MKATLDKLGRPLRDLRISLTDQCNFRCAYCMPKEVFGPNYSFLPKEQLLTDQEIIRLARGFRSLGVQKIRLTGGEPLLRPGIHDLIEALFAETGVEDITLTTNAALLERHLEPLKKAGVKRLNISLDSLDPESFSKMSGRPPEVLQNVLRNIELADDAGFDLKINMVVQRGVNDEQIIPMASHFMKQGSSLRFIEYMDVGSTNQWQLNEVTFADEILERISELYAFEPLPSSYLGEVASRYRYLDTDSEFGIISSVSKPFCSQCNRARLSADGKFFTCLFATVGHDMKPLIRSDADDTAIVNTISSIWSRRADRYSELRSEMTEAQRKAAKIEMSYIGG